MNKIKTNFAIIVSLLLTVSFLYLFLNNRNKCNNVIDKLLFYKYVDSLSHSIEGLNIWDISSVTNTEFNNIFELNSINSEYIFFIAIDSINCMNCFNFHSEHWGEIVNKIPTFVYTKSLFQFVKAGNINAAFFEIKAKKQIQLKSKKLNFSSFLLNKNGKILYGDISELKEFNRSELFYMTVKRQIN